MLRVIAVTLAVFAIGSLATSWPQSAEAKRMLYPQPSETRRVDLAIALDVSGSMSGLIESAKQRLWDIVNELGRAQPQPVLRVAVLSYGNPAYGAQSGYVRVDQPLTSDLDAVNETLFAFGTNGGDEYVARAVDTSVKSLQWSTEPDALRIIFVAGNESATQDPQIRVEQAVAAATGKGIVVNTIYCGDEGDGIAPGWRRVASLANGMYASIDQNAAAVANIATPMDQKLLELNKELNETYVAFGRDGKRYRKNQLAQDENAAKMSPAAAASRTKTKVSGLYNSSDWDLVDAVKSGKDLEQVAEDDLPAEMQAMEAEERRDFVQKKTEQRQELQREITELDTERRAYIAEKRRDQQNATGKGLDEAIQEGLRTVAEQKGFTFEE